MNGDKAIEEGVKSVYTKGKINKGTSLRLFIAINLLRRRQDNRQKINRLYGFCADFRVSF